MLATEKISKAFLAIVEEAEKLQASADNENVQAGLKTIVSIAKHQSDIRNAKKGGCKSSHNSRMTPDCPA